MSWIRRETEKETVQYICPHLKLKEALDMAIAALSPLNDWAKVTPFGVLFFGSEELMNWETLCEEWGYGFKAYRRPPEVEA